MDGTGPTGTQFSPYLQVIKIGMLIIVMAPALPLLNVVSMAKRET